MNKFKIWTIIGLLLLGFLTYFTAPYWSRSSKEIQVTSQAVKAVDGEHKYLVFTSDGVYENSDSWYYFKFDSSDVQSKLAQGGRFKISYFGWRVPFLSKYPNIVSAERIK